MNTPRFPPYAFVPGGPWPHPRSAPGGHSFGHVESKPPRIEDGHWAESPTYLEGFDLFNAGYYWEAHESWELLWHAHNRSGPTADILKALIKLAAAGVKVREGQPRGVSIHMTRAAELFAKVRRDVGSAWLGLDLEDWETIAQGVAEHPLPSPAGRESAVVVVFSFRLQPRRAD